MVAYEIMSVFGRCTTVSYVIKQASGGQILWVPSYLCFLWRISQNPIGLFSLWLSDVIFSSSCLLNRLPLECKTALVKWLISGSVQAAPLLDGERNWQLKISLCGHPRLEVAVTFHLCSYVLFAKCDYSFGLVLLSISKDYLSEIFLVLEYKQPVWTEWGCPGCCGKQAWNMNRAREVKREMNVDYRECDFCSFSLDTKR